MAATCVSRYSSRGGLEIAVVGKGTSDPLESSRRPIAQPRSDTCPCQLGPEIIYFPLTSPGNDIRIHTDMQEYCNKGIKDQVDVSKYTVAIQSRGCL